MGWVGLGYKDKGFSPQAAAIDVAGGRGGGGGWGGAPWEGGEGGGHLHYVALREPATDPIIRTDVLSYRLERSPAQSSPTPLAGKTPWPGKYQRHRGRNLFLQCCVLFLHESFSTRAAAHAHLLPCHDLPSSFFSHCSAIWAQVL